MSKKQACIEHVKSEIKTCNDIIATYNKRFNECDTKDAKKALRKELRIAKVKRTLSQCVAIQELLECITSDISLDTHSKASNYILSITHEAKEREAFIICKDDTIVSLFERYDNFSFVKVKKYCAKHNIKYNEKERSFDFSQCDTSVLDTYDDSDDSDD